MARCVYSLLLGVLIPFTVMHEATALCEFTSDPCVLTNNEELPYTLSRDPSIEYTSATDNSKYCDLYALGRGTWYRSSYNMTNYCVYHRTCGTSDPVYLNGSIPSPSDGVVDAVACVRTYGICCEHTLNLRIKNCNNYFMAYCFIDINPNCHSRFCFDVGQDAATPTTTTTSKTTTTTTTTSATTSTTETAEPSEQSDDDDEKTDISHSQQSTALCEFTSDPCVLTNNEELPYTLSRDPSIEYTAATDNSKYCDLYALDHGTWYRSSYNMTNYCVDHRRCGTSDPVYLNGSIPSPSDGVVDAVACVRTYGICCEHTLNLRIKNCNNYFMAYCFIDLNPNCHSRFCFDIGQDAATPITTTTSTTTTTTTTTSGTTSTTATAEPSEQSDDDDEKTHISYSHQCGGNEAWIVLAVWLVMAGVTIVSMGVMIYRLRRTILDVGLLNGSTSTMMYKDDKKY